RRRVSHSMGKRKSAAPMKVCNSTTHPCWLHKPPCTASLKEDHTRTRMTLRSKIDVNFLYRANQRPHQRRMNWPSAKGSKSSCATFSMVPPRSIVPASPPGPPIIRPTSKGVRNTPSKVDKVALSTAPATLPRAMAVMATEEDTVEGSTARKKKPISSSWEIKPPSVHDRMSHHTGNIT